MPEIEVRSREAIAEFLPRAIESALFSYEQFSLDHSTSNESLQSKDFKAHHDACKVAIAHIELLIKLAQWADLPDPKLEDEDKQRLLQNLIESSKTELGRE